MSLTEIPKVCCYLDWHYLFLLLVVALNSELSTQWVFRKTEYRELEIPTLQCSVALIHLYALQAQRDSTDQSLPHLRRHRELYRE